MQVFRFTPLFPNTCSYPWLAAHCHKMLLCLQHYPVYKDVTEPRGQEDALPYSLVDLKFHNHSQSIISNARTDLPRHNQ